MLKIRYRPSFIRQYKKLPRALQVEIREKIEVFRLNAHNSTLRTHKLKGRLKGSLSFSVNYRYCIVFEYESAEIVALLAVGDHDIYDV